MANYCVTKYVVEGNLDTLNKIKDVINSVAKCHEGFNLAAVLVELGLYTEESLKDATKDYTEDTPEGLGTAGDWRDAEVKELNGNTVLTFTEEYKWNCSCNMESLAKLNPWNEGITAVFRLSEEPGTGINETTDVDGKYFSKGIKIASGMSAGEYRRIAEQIITEQFNNK